MISFWKIIFLLVIYIKTNKILVSGQTDEPSNIYCNPDWCKEHVECSDKPLNCTTIGFRKIISPQPCNCCPYCFNYLKEKDPCLRSLASTLPPPNMCGPELECRLDPLADEDNCEKMEREEGTCMYELRRYEANVGSGNVGIAQFKPECDAHGFYNPRQCLPGSICFCMSAEGQRIFGVGFPDVEMDCACARDVERLKAFGFQGTFPHCLSNGNYDELQCNVYTRRCYCLTKPEETVAIQNLEELPCFDEESHPKYEDTPYLQPCELAVSTIHFDILNIQNGSDFMISDKPICAPDGKYALIQSRDQNWVCTDPTGQPIEDFEAEKISSTPGDMNCYCAMTRFMSSSSAGKPKCCPNGNYYAMQCSGLTCYCVDELGRQDMSIGEVPLDDVEILPCFENPC